MHYDANTRGQNWDHDVTVHNITFEYCTQYLIHAGCFLLYRKFSIYKGRLYELTLLLSTFLMSTAVIFSATCFIRDL